MSDYITVRCAKTDCSYHTPDPADAAMCRCTHADKRLHMTQVVCPLYHVNWLKTEPGPRETAPKGPRRLEQDF